MERKRERKRERRRQTDRQTDRQAQTETNKKIDIIGLKDRNKDGLTGRDKDKRILAFGQTDRWKERKKKREKKTEKEKDRLTNPIFTEIDLFDKIFRFCSISFLLRLQEIVDVEI